MPTQEKGDGHQSETRPTLPAVRLAIALNAIQDPAPAAEAGLLVTLVIVEPVSDRRWTVDFPWLPELGQIDVTMDETGEFDASCPCAMQCPHIGAVDAVLSKPSLMDFML